MSTKLLMELQELDAKLKDTERVLSALEGELPNLKKLKQAEKDYLKRKDELLHQQGDLKLKNLEVQELQQKEKELNSRLYSGQIKSGKELEKLKKEMDFSKQKRAKTEEEALAMMEAVEKCDKELSGTQNLIDSLKTQTDNEEKERQEKLPVIRQELSQLKEKRNALVNQIDELPYKTYQNLYEETDGTPVAKVEGETCAGCFMTLSTATVDKVRQQETLVLCTNCGRILDWA